jgi:hypothetical protein
MRFSRELMVSALSSGLCEYQAFELLPLSGGSLAWGNHPFVHELTSTQLTAGGVLSIESSCPYLGTLTSLGPLDSQLCLLNSGITILHCPAHCLESHCFIYSLSILEVAWGRR